MSRIVRTEAGAHFATAVEYHGFVYTRGFVTNDASLGIEGQVRDVLAQLDAVLEQHGTDNTRMLQAQIWLKNIADRAVFNEVWASWLPEGVAPARAVVQAELGEPEWLVEIMVTTCK
jgi:enamine deaminase RidA (YjgF/YER057c/UK114 family)